MLFINTQSTKASQNETRPPAVIKGNININVIIKTHSAMSYTLVVVVLVISTGFKRLFISLIIVFRINEKYPAVLNCNNIKNIINLFITYEISNVSC